jgi:hypothetical protein
VNVVGLRSVKRLLGFAACALWACAGSNGAAMPDAGQTKPSTTKAADSGMHADAMSSAPNAQSGWPFNPSFDAGILEFPSICPLKVGAECDGREDCPGDTVCCGHFDQRVFSYTRISCDKSCSGSDQFQLCHADDACGSGLVCRLSLVLPYSFISVCAPPTPAPSGQSTGKSVAGRVACGDRSCEVGRDKCCLTAHFDGNAPYPVAEQPYCAPVDQACECSHVDHGGGPTPASGDDAGM